MSSIYNKHYYEHYDVGVETVDYSNSRYTKDFLEGIANRIADDLAPKTVLDAGCAMGHLVAALRDRGIEAYGVDISEYAVTHVREDIRPYCFQGSLSDPLPEGLPKKFDLVVTIEVLEHLYAEDSRKAIENLCQITDAIIFSSTPDDFEDPTHLNVQQRDYWAALFAQNGFLDDLSYRPTYLTHYAVCYRKRDNLVRQIQDYERNIARTETEHRREIENWNEVVQDHKKHLAEAQTALVNIQTEYAQLQQASATELAQKEVEINQVCQAHAAELAQKRAEMEQHDQAHIAELAQKQAEMERLNQTHATELAQKQAEIEQHDQAHIAELAQKQAEMERLNQTHTTELARKQAEIEQHDQAHIAELARKQVEIEQHDQAHIAELAQKQVEMEQMRSTYEETLDHLQTEMKGLEGEYYQKVIQVRKTLDREKVEWIEKNERKHQEMIEQILHENQVHIDEINGELENIELEIMQLQESHESEKDSLCTNWENEKMMLLAQKNEEVNQLRQLHQNVCNEKLNLERQLFNIQEINNALLHSTSWRVTAPMRRTKDILRATVYSHEPLRLMYKGIRSVCSEGAAATWKKVRLRHHAILEAKREAKEAVRAPKEIEESVKFSILVPLYNTPEAYLHDMINSVRMQTYSNWELCLADGSDAQHLYVKQKCHEYTIRDGRIKYKKLKKNMGISENTNACAEMATGDYIVLLDHDDFLSQDALMENCLAIQQTGADVLYSDEDHFSVQHTYVNPFYKPDWSPDLLYCQMYICHLLVFRKSLFDRVGRFSTENNGAQDYDMMLRLSEKANQIHHIPKVLYHWRDSENSTAMNANSKPYAHDAGRNALDSHLKRKYNGHAYAEDGKYLFTYCARFTWNIQPLISIIIPMKDKSEMTNACVESILSKSRYQHYEILILDNRSEQPETFAWFKEIQAKDQRIRVIPADMEFNWSKLNNWGIHHANGDVYVFLNNDTLVISADWLERLSENALRDDIGVVGAQLLYEDQTIQHAGVVVGFGGWADHVFKGMKPIHNISPYVSPALNRDVLAVTGACMAISKKTIETIGNFDETFVICGSDVELCIRAHEKGLFNMYNADVQLYHLESKSRDSFIPEIDFERSYATYTPYREHGDPFYNINLDMNSVIPKVRN